MSPVSPMKTPRRPSPRLLLALAALAIAAASPLLRAAAPDPVPFPALTAPDPDHTAPKLLHRVEPVYPADATEARERRVYVAFLVAVDGSVKNASAMFGPPAAFADAAVAAVGQWRFKPGHLTASGKPVWTQMTVELHFKPPTERAPSAR